MLDDEDSEFDETDDDDDTLDTVDGDTDIHGGRVQYLPTKLVHCTSFVRF